MKYYSESNPDYSVTLEEAVMNGLAPDQGLYMPAHWPQLEMKWIKTMKSISFHEIAWHVASKILGEDLPEQVIENLINHTIQFDAPLVSIEDGIAALELFHGPTLAFKDFGARFLSSLLGYMALSVGKEITVLVATSGDTGSAVANGFLNIKGTRVVVLYPSGKVSDIQEKQFTTLGHNITALEIDGTFDDCQKLVKQAFSDNEVHKKLLITSANSINIARLIPQTFYYFYAYSRLEAKDKPLVVSVPSGNFGNLTAGLITKKMGLPIEHFVAATNSNNIVPYYLETGNFVPGKSCVTISSAMDVGNPSNFARILDLYHHNREMIRRDVTGYSFTDVETADALRYVLKHSSYLMDPHGAVGYLGLKKYLSRHGGYNGIFLETAHPGKFQSIVEEITGNKIKVPETLEYFLNKKKLSITLGKEFRDFRDFLMSM